MGQHVIAGTLWLGLAIGGIGFAAKSGLEGSARYKVQQVVNKELKAAIGLAERGQIKESIGVMEKLAVRYPKEPTLWLNLGIARRADQQFEAADEAFVKALVLNPDDYDAIAERATVAKERGKVDDALSLLEKIPVGEGRMVQRLVQDPVWDSLRGDERMKKIRIKHNVVSSTSFGRRSAQGVAHP